MDEPSITADDLPVSFQVKYLGYRPARGLWGIKHTRKPVNDMVEAFKKLPKDKILPFVRVEVSKDGLSFRYINIDKKSKEQPPTIFKVDCISYGVQDLVYTRIFSMIIVNDVDLKEGLPFVCHAFACDSKSQARELTYALAAAFQHYGQKVKDGGDKAPKRFAIDLRSPQEIEDDEEDETEA